MLSELPTSQALSPGLKMGEGKKASFVLLTSHGDEELEALGRIEKKEVALFVPSDWLLTRDRMDQDWTINLPKGKGQETLYSTTFFWNPIAEPVDQILQYASQKGWAIYTEAEEKLCMLIVNSKVAVDVDPEKVKGQFV